MRSVACDGGHMTQSTLPLMSPNGTGPYERESDELLRLSPSNHTWPRGTCNIQKRDPVNMLVHREKNLRKATFNDESRADNYASRSNLIMKLNYYSTLSSQIYFNKLTLQTKTLQSNTFMHSKKYHICVANRNLNQ